MAKESKKASAATSSALTRRYGSIAEIKREFFPRAAAEEEAAASSALGDGIYEDLMDELFGPQQQAQT